jgi:hypothetical protein
MQITVVSDSQGVIQCLCGVAAPEKSGHTFTPVLKPGERLDVLDVPAAYEKRPLQELHTDLHVSVQGGKAVLVARA